MNRILPGSELNFLLGDAARLWRQAVERALSDADLGLTGSEVRTLTYVARFEGTRQRDLAGLMGIEPMTLSAMLEVLEKRGLVDRRIDPRDRRARCIHLTAEATAVFERIAPASRLVQDHALDGFSMEQRRAFESALRVVRGNLMRHVCSAGRIGSAAGNRPEAA